MAAKLAKLKMAIFESALSQAAIAKVAGIAISTLSQAINGRVNLTDAERRRIADVLGVAVGDLF